MNFTQCENYWTGIIVQIATGRIMDVIFIIVNFIYLIFNIFISIIVWRIKNGQNNLFNRIIERTSRNGPIL